MSRYNVIKGLRELKWSYQMIADKLGVSRQRVHQLYKRDSATVEEKYYRYAREGRPEKTCKQCGKLFTIMSMSEADRRYHCSRGCRTLSDRKK